jgi:hypothetical protein
VMNAETRMPKSERNPKPEFLTSMIIGIKIIH